MSPVGAVVLEQVFKFFDDFIVGSDAPLHTAHCVDVAGDGETVRDPETWLSVSVAEFLSQRCLWCVSECV